MFCFRQSTRRLAILFRLLDRYLSGEVERCARSEGVSLYKSDHPMSRMPTSGTEMAIGSRLEGHARTCALPILCCRQPANHMKFSSFSFQTSSCLVKCEDLNSSKARCYAAHRTVPYAYITYSTFGTEDSDHSSSSVCGFSLCMASGPAASHTHTTNGSVFFLNIREPHSHNLFGFFRQVDVRCRVNARCCERDGDHIDVSYPTNYQLLL